MLSGKVKSTAETHLIEEEAPFNQISENSDGCFESTEQQTNFFKF